MSTIQTRAIVIFVALATLMAVTRFNHFGSAMSLPDASLAVFFLGGLYLSRSVRGSMMIFIALILEAGCIDYYATSVQGVSDWCMTPAYWFLIPTYASLWLAGHWCAPGKMVKGRAMESRELPRLALGAWASGSFAFIFSNVTFYLFSGRFAEMSVLEYASRVAQYYVPYVSVALLYIFCALAIHMAVEISSRQRAHSL